MKLSEFDYSLPATQIAQYPLKQREASRLLVLHRKTGKMEHRFFRDLPGYLERGDALVLNDTKVMRARMFGRKETGGKIEVLLLRKISSLEYEVLLKPSGRIKIGSHLFFDGHGEAEWVGGRGTVQTLRFFHDGVERWMRKKGTLPLPPYISRSPERQDFCRYQTVYAKREGAVAAPTAGLHFTKALLRRLERKGVRLCRATLHVGYGTFEPVRSAEISEHRMHEEFFEVSSRATQILNQTRKAGGRIVAVGTTSCRLLETAVRDNTLFYPKKGWTALFIHPPYRFKGTDALLTNFHLPKTTLLMLIAAFAGMEGMRHAYEEAIRKKYRFYSYGDAMLIL